MRRLMRMRRPWMRMGLLVLAWLLCGEALPGARPPAWAGEPTKIRAGIIKIAAMASLHLGGKLGYFREEGVVVEPLFTAGGAAAVPAMLGGSIEVALTGVNVTIHGRERGFPLTIISDSEKSQAAPPDTAAVLVRADSPIRSLRDLAGRTLAINTLNSIIWLTPVVLAKRIGMDPKSIRFPEIPFPNMNQALLEGKVDAISQIEPFTTMLRESGKARVIAWPYVETMPGLPIAHFVATDDWIRRNPAAVRGFARGVQKAMRYLNAHEREARQAMAEFTGMPPALANKTTMIVWSPVIDQKALQTVADLMLEHGVIRSRVDVSTFIHETAR